MTGQVFTGALKCAAISEIEIYTVGHFLTILVRDIGGKELGERESFGDDSRITVCFRGRQDQGPLSVDGHVPAFPELFCEISRRSVTECSKLTNVSGNCMLTSPISTVAEGISCIGSFCSAMDSSRTGGGLKAVAILRREAAMLFDILFSNRLFLDSFFSSFTPSP